MTIFKDKLDEVGQAVGKRYSGGFFTLTENGFTDWTFKVPQPTEQELLGWIAEDDLAEQLAEKYQHKLHLLTEEVSGWLVERHHEQKEITNQTTSLTEAEFQELLVWRQALRDVHFTKADDLLPPPPTRIVGYINDKLHVHHPEQPKHDVNAPHHQILAPVKPT